MGPFSATECDQAGEKSFELLCHGRKPGPQAGQTVIYIHSPTQLHDLGPRRGQTVRSIHSLTELL